MTEERFREVAESAASGASLVLDVRELEGDQAVRLAEAVRSSGASLMLLHAGLLAEEDHRAIRAAGGERVAFEG